MIFGKAKRSIALTLILLLAFAMLPMVSGTPAAASGRVYLESDIFAIEHSGLSRHPLNASFIMRGISYGRGISLSTWSTSGTAHYDISGRGVTRLSGMFGWVSGGGSNTVGILTIAGDGASLGSFSLLRDDVPVLIDVAIPSGVREVVVTIQGQGGGRFGFGDAFFADGTAPPPPTMQFTITATAGAGGTVSGGGAVNQNAQAAVIAVPNAGWTFSGWYEGGTRVSTNATFSFTATANRTLQAQFRQLPPARTWQEEYTRILQSYLLRGGYANSQRDRWEFAPASHFVLHDIDRDGVPELIIFNSMESGLTGERYHYNEALYTFRGGNVVELEWCAEALGGGRTFLGYLDGYRQYSFQMLYQLFEVLGNRPGILAFVYHDYSSPGYHQWHRDTVAGASIDNILMVRGDRLTTERRFSASAPLWVGGNDEYSSRVFIDKREVSEAEYMRVLNSYIGNPIAIHGLNAANIQRVISGWAGPVAPPPPPPPTQQPSTVQNQHSAWARAELERAAQLNLIPVTLQNSRVDLREPITRAEFAGVVVMTFESLANTTALPAITNRFSDTTNAYVLRAYNSGLMVGVSAAEFAPNTLLNREQAATALTRSFKRATIPGWTFANDREGLLNFTRPTPFADSANISGWARESVYFMSANGIIQGTGNNMFSPRAVTNAQQAAGYAQATREQALLIALRMVENLG